MKYSIGKRKNFVLFDRQKLAAKATVLVYEIVSSVETDDNERFSRVEIDNVVFNSSACFT